MAAILQFQSRKKSERLHLDEGHSAVILLYTGVRFERIDFEALKTEATNNVQAESAIAVRFAN